MKIEQILKDKKIPFYKKMMVLERLHKFPSSGMKEIKAIVEGLGREQNPRIDEMGFFGNVWVRKQYYPTAGDYHKGHKHKHDHVSLLAQGSIELHVEGFEPRRFDGPTFFIVKAEHNHHIIALEDETVSYCVYALRDYEGQVDDIYSGDNTPYGVVR